MSESLVYFYFVSIIHESLLSKLDYPALRLRDREGGVYGLGGRYKRGQVSKTTNGKWKKRSFNVFFSVIVFIRLIVIIIIFNDIFSPFYEHQYRNVIIIC